MAGFVVVEHVAQPATIHGLAASRADQEVIGLGVHVRDIDGAPVEVVTR